MSTEIFLAHIANADFKSAREVLCTGTVNIKYKDPSGNTILHLMINGLVAKLKEIWQYFTRRSYPIDRLVEPRKVTEQCAEEFYKVVEILLELGFNYDERNNSNITPVELLNGVSISFCDPTPAEIQKELIIKFEKIGYKLYPGRKYVSSFDLHTGSVHPKALTLPLLIPDECLDFNQKDGLPLSLHQRLEILEQYFQNSGKNALNLVFVNIGFMVAKEGNNFFVSIPISDPEKLVIKLDETFKHSEQAFYDYIKQPKIISRLVGSLVKAMATSGAIGLSGFIIDSIILDLHSSREVCDKCDSILHELQTDTSPGSFLANLRSTLTKFGFKLPETEKLPIGFRITGFEDASAYGNKDNDYPMHTICEDHPRDIRMHDAGVRFHIAPKNSEHFFSRIAKCDNESIRNLYENRSLYFLKETATISLKLQTGFANASAREVLRSSVAEVLLKGKDVLKYDLHQVASFHDLGKMCEDIIAITKFGKQSLDTILQYLFNIKNPKAEIDILLQELIPLESELGVFDELEKDKDESKNFAESTKSHQAILKMKCDTRKISSPIKSKTASDKDTVPIKSEAIPIELSKPPMRLATNSAGNMLSDKNSSVIPAMAEKPNMKNTKRKKFS